MRKVLSSFVVVGVVLVVWASPLDPVGPKTKIGDVTGFSVLLPANPDCQEKYAGNLLAEGIGKLTGFTPQIVEEGGALPSGKFFAVGRTALAAKAGIVPLTSEQGCKLAVSGGNVFVTGGTRGPFQAVVALLEEDWGVRWFTRYAEPKYPKTPADGLAVTPRQYVPPFDVRECWFVDTVRGATWRKFNAQTRGAAARPAHPDLEKEAGYGTTFTTSIVVNENVPPVAWDVFARRELPFDGRRFDLTMDRLRGKVVAFLPESPAPFSVALPKTVRSGEAFDVAVTTSGKCAVPFTVRVADPSGAVSEEYRGRLVSGQGGRTSVRFAFAENDLTGVWTVSVRNEFTGETKQAVVCLGGGSEER